jgi:hypothetical protein
VPVEGAMTSANATLDAPKPSTPSVPSPSRKAARRGTPAGPRALGYWPNTWGGTAGSGLEFEKCGPVLKGCSKAAADAGGMRSIRILLAAGLMAAGTALLVPAPAAAAPSTWTWDGTGADLAVGIAGNLNAQTVAVVNRLDGRVYTRRPPAAGWTDLGAPAEGGVPVRPTKLVTSAGQVFASAPTGVYERTLTGWQRIGGPVADLLASRTGELRVDADQTTRFHPNLYAVDASGYVLRYTTQWSVIGAGGLRAPGALTERGGTGARLFMLNTDRSQVLEWTGTPMSWTTIGGPASSIAGGPADLVMIDGGTGRPRLYQGTPGRWSAVAHGDPVPAGGQVRLGAVTASGSTLYHLTADRKTLRANTVRMLPGGRVVAAGWRRLATDGMRDLTVTGGDGMSTDLAVLTSSGRVRRFSPGTVEGDWSVSDFASLGRAVDYSMQPFTSWTGTLLVSHTTGRLPAGVRVEGGPDGSVRLRGTPLELGSFPYAVTGTDSTGAEASVGYTLTVLPPDEPLTRIIPTPTFSVREIVVRNCLGAGLTMPVWIRDITAGTGWQQARDTPLGPCAGDEWRYSPAPRHVVEVIALDVTDEMCGGNGGYDTAACVAFDAFFRGADADGLMRVATFDVTRR